MNTRMLWFHAALLAVCTALAPGCRQTRPGAAGDVAMPSVSDANEMEEPLLLLDDEELLLLPDEPGEADGPLADNSRCHVCHLNYLQEALAVDHARAGLGCADCHGASDEHIADESWASGGNGTAPDTIYPLDRINDACFACHSREKLGAEAHEDFLAGVGDETVCTDCHGEHRLPVRKCKWK